MSTNAKKNGKKKKTGKEIAVIVFAIFIAISMMIPSIGYIINYYNMQTQQQEHPVTAEQVDETFTKEIDQVNEKIKKDSNNADLYNELGNDYLQWASYATVLPVEGQDTAAVIKERTTKALDAFNASLEISTTEAGVVGKALALTMLNEPDQAETLLEGYLKDHPESTSAYQMLAQVFEIKGEQEKALETYEKMKNSTNDVKLQQRAQNAIDRIKNPEKSQQGESEQPSEESSNNN